MSKSTLTNLAETIINARVQNLRTQRGEDLAGYLEAVARGENLPTEILDQSFPIDADIDCTLRYMTDAELWRIAVYRLTRYTKALQDAMELAKTIEVVCSLIEASDGDTLDEIA